MARRVPGPAPGLEYPFTPDVPGEPVRIILRRPTEAIKREYNRLSAPVEVALDDRGKPKGDTARMLPEAPRVRSERERWLLEQCVVRVEEYIGADGKPIATGAQLWEHGESEIFWPVVAELVTGASLTTEQKKTSEDSSHSTPPPPAQPPGTAESASAASSTAPVDAGPESEQPQA